MKAVITLRMKEGYLIVERENESLTMEEVMSATVVEDDSFSCRDKVGRIAVEILNTPKDPPVPAPEAKDDIPF